MTELTPRESLLRTADCLVAGTKAVMERAETEEDLRIGFEKLLEPIREQLGLVCQPKYEQSIYAVGRSDSVHGRVIIEYEAPGSFRRRSLLEHAHEQLVGYIQGIAREHKDRLFIFDPQFVGIGFDGEQVFFIRYRGEKAKPKTRLAKRDFWLIGPYPFNRESARTLLTHMRALSRRLLTAEELAAVFGPDGTVAREAVAALVDAMENWGDSPRPQTFYSEWRRLFGIVYGEHFTGQLAREAADLAGRYGVGTGTDFQRLLFCVHTYFVFLMKLIVAELLTMGESSFLSSFSHDLAHSTKRSLREKLESIESGGVYARRKVTNFLEGDFFRWYLDALSPRLEAAIREIARAFSEFEPATTTIAPEQSTDLLKKLYQYLVPASVRHNLGEFYTPDWLAEMVLREARYTGNTRKRLLDPACGSGTFLVLAIHKARQHAAKQGLSGLETGKRVVASIWGFDLNPLAVIAARTNYLFALGNIAEEMAYLEIPVYLADSVLWPKRAKQLAFNFEGGEVVHVGTSARDFHVPSIWVNDGGFLMKRAAPLVEEMVRSGYTAEEALARLRREGLVFPPHDETVRRFYDEILGLEQDGRNGIWARFLKNAFAPMIAGKFDFVVGNPPWIRWAYLSEDYRQATLDLWRDYGLFSLKGHAARLGGGEKDFSMLFTYSAIDNYLADKGKLAFLITQEVFKSKGAGEGFRRFRIGDRSDFRVLQAADLVQVQPFEGAANKTAMIIAKKGETQKYPVPYTVYRRRKGVGKIATDTPLSTVRALLKKEQLIATPMANDLGSWQTVPPRQKGLLKLAGHNAYKARLGARVEPYGVFWLAVEEVTSDGYLVVHNLADRGKREVPTVQESIESALVHPAVSGADIERWHAQPGVYVLMPQDPQQREPYPESLMKQRWPRTYAYLTRFRDVLLSRGSKTVREFAERTAFYAMYGIGPYTVASYRVVWKRMAADLTAAVLSQAQTPFGYKTAIATDTTSLFATENEEEAHYLCAILNSTPVREFVKSYSSAGRGFGAPSVMEPIGIPQFDAKDATHGRLAALSRELHEAAAEGEALKLPRREKQVDAAVRRMFGLRQ
jgi:hypothetical protein